MRIHYRKTKNGVEIVRCFGADSHVELPGEIGGRPVVHAAAYTFSARKDKEEDDVLIYEAEEGRLFRQQERLLAGGEVESIVFPDSMEKIGRYIFYGCQNLRELYFSDSLTDVGSGAFTGCRALKRLGVRLLKGERSCVPEILGDLWQRIDVAFFREAEEARLVFPGHYEEAVENTPARILFTQHHGSGNNYRQCFYNKEPDYRKYDDLFSVARAWDDTDVLTDLIFSRLLYPVGLTRRARDAYEAYVKEHGAKISFHLVDTENMEALRAMSKRTLWTEQTLGEAVDYAAQTGRSEVLSFLMNEKYRLFPVKRGKYEL